MYLTLPSNASMDIFPNNTQSHFFVHLPQPITLNAGFEVALVEIHLPSCWDNIDEYFNTFLIQEERPNRRIINFPEIEIPPSDQYTLDELCKEMNEVIPDGVMIKFTCRENGVLHVENPQSYEIRFRDFGENIFEDYGSEGWITSKMYDLKINRVINIPPCKNQIHIRFIEESKGFVTESTEIKLPLGQYLSPEHLIKTINECLKEKEISQVKFKVELNNKISIIAPNNYKIVFPNEGLGVMLGFDERIVSGEGKYSIDMNRGVYGMYVYTNIIIPQIVGDTYAPLLRVIPNIDRKRSLQGIVKVFDNPDYYPLSCGTIEIDIRNDYGQRINFQTGKTIVKLHFRINKDGIK